MGSMDYSRSVNGGQARQARSCLKSNYSYKTNWLLGKKQPLCKEGLLGQAVARLLFGGVGCRTLLTIGVLLYPLGNCFGYLAVALQVFPECNLLAVNNHAVDR